MVDFGQANPKERRQTLRREFSIEKLVAHRQEEAARVDGARDWQVLVRIILPISLPGIAVAGLLSTIFSWNEFLFAVTFTYTSAPTVPVFISSYMTSEGLFWARMSMAISLAIVIPVLLGWAAQKQLVRGLTLGAVKG